MNERDPRRDLLRQRIRPWWIDWPWKWGQNRRRDRQARRVMDEWFRQQNDDDAPA